MAGATAPFAVQCTRNKIARVRPCSAEALGGLRKGVAIGRTIGPSAERFAPVRVRAAGWSAVPCLPHRSHRYACGERAGAPSLRAAPCGFASLRVRGAAGSAVHGRRRERDRRLAQTARRPLARDRFATRRSPRLALNRSDVERQSCEALRHGAARVIRSCLAELNRPPQVAKHRARSPGGGPLARARFFRAAPAPTTPKIS